MISQDKGRISNEVAIAIIELELIGYFFLVIDNVIKYSFEGKKIDPAYIRSRLTAIKQHHDLAILFLINRSNPFDLAAYLLDASTRAIEAARDAENKGDLHLARHEWGRFTKLSAALSDLIGEEPEGEQSWEEWIKIIKDKSSNTELNK